MATKVNKSEEVRKLKDSGVTSGMEIVTKLKAKGIKVAPSQVYQILAGKKGKKGKKKRAKATTPSSNGDVIDTAITSVRQAGGVEKARELLSKLAMLKV